MADDLEVYLRDLPFRLKRELVTRFNTRIDRAAEVLAEAAPFQSGRTRESVRVRRARGTLEAVIEAGGPMTTKEVRKGSGESYDYAVGIEFGNEHVEAQPWFYSTWFGGLRDETQEGINDDVADILGRL